MPKWRTVMQEAVLHIRLALLSVPMLSMEVVECSFWKFLKDVCRPHSFGIHTKKGYCILNDKHLPLHSNLLRSISHTFDTFWAIMWNLPTISYRWSSLAIEDDCLSNKLMTKKHYITNDLLLSIFPCSATCCH